MINLIVIEMEIQKHIKSFIICDIIISFSLILSRKDHFCITLVYLKHKDHPNKFFLVERNKIIIRITNTAIAN